MLVYITPIAILYISSYVKGERVKKYIFVFSCIYLAVVSGIRYMVGTDYNIQVSYYNWTLHGYTDNFLEPGFRKYIYSIDRFFGKIDWFFIIASIFVMFAFAFAISKFVNKKYRIVALAIYITSTVFFATMNIERQYIAIGFLIFSLYFLFQNKYIFTMIFYCLAISFHQSASVFLIYYILYFIARKIGIKKMLKIYELLIYISVFFLIVDIRPIIIKLSDLLPLGKYAGYLTSVFFQNREMDSMLKCIVPTILAIYIIEKFNNICIENEYIEYLFHGLFIYVLINNLFYGINIFLRVNMYFEWFMIVILPSVISTGKDAVSRASIKTILLTYFLLLTIYAIFINNGHSVLPYQTIFSN